MWFLKIFLPKWNFFETFEQFPILEVRTGASEKSLSEWKSFEDRSFRSPLNLFFNPKGNYRMLMNTLVERCLLDIQGQKNIKNIDFKKMDSYQVLNRSIRERLGRLMDLSDGSVFQFQISLVEFKVMEQNSEAEELIKTTVLKSSLERF